MDEDDVVKKRSLNPTQKARAEEALDLVPSAVRAFMARHPCYARLLPRCDLTSVAQLAVVEASFCYDPEKSKPTTYYGSAIQHALLKEVRRLQRSRDCANERVDLAKALNLKGATDQRQQAVECLRLLPPEDRELIESHIVEGHSLMSIARKYGRDWRTIKQRLLRALGELRACVDTGTCTPADRLDPEPSGQDEPLA